MKTCEYGCGREAKYQFKNGKWCCSKTHQSCPVLRKKNSEKNSNRKCNKFTKLYNIDINILCENGCGKVAKYVTLTGKKYCCEDQRKCLVNRKKRSEGLSKVTTWPKGQDSKLFGRKRPNHSQCMKKNNPMFVEKHKQKVKEITSSQAYKKEMSSTITQIFIERPELKVIISKHSIAMWEVKGLWTPEDQLDELTNYRRQVAKYTNRSLRKYRKIINPNNFPIGIGRGDDCYSVDHIFSIIEGFRQDVDPILIGSHHNLQIILFRDNAKKQGKCEINLKELENRANNI